MISLGTNYYMIGEMTYCQNGNNCYITFRDLNEDTRTFWINCATGQIVKLIDQKVANKNFNPYADCL